MAHKITHKFILKAKIKTLSPILMGIGAGLSADKEISRDENGNPFIPASGFCGAMSNAFLKDFGLPVEKDALKWDKNWVYFWGDELSYRENGEDCSLISKSHIAFDNLYIADSKVAIAHIRDGVVINRGTGISDNKYDYEILEPGNKFGLLAEVTVREEFSREEFLKILGYIIRNLRNDFYRFGAHTSFGFGKIEVEDPRIHEFDFTNKKIEVLESWLAYRSSQDVKGAKDVTDEAVKISAELRPKLRKWFSIQADCIIRSSLLTGGDAPNDAKSDKTHLHSYNSEKKQFFPVLSGKSLKGALRSRAEKILTAISNPNDELVSALFGSEKVVKGKARKSKLLIEETVLNPDDVIRQLQDRVKIDRFTGGASDTAKFDSEPLMQKNDNAFSIQMRIENYSNKEAGLMLLLLKDLVTSDLSVGAEKNVGRGLLKGKKGVVSWIESDGEKTEIAINDTGIVDVTKAEKLQFFVNELNESNA